MSFRKDFLWGAAMAAHQCEGSFEGDGKSRGAGESEDFHKPLSDFYHHYKEDIDLLHELGAKAFRFSIDWSRVFPTSDMKPNMIGVNYYLEMFKRLKGYGIEPIITLCHMEHPYWINTEYGGWKNKKVIDLFAQYARSCFEWYGDYVKYWLTFNEINGGAVEKDGFASKLMGLPEGSSREDELRGYHNQFVASALATKIAHEMNKDLKVGCMIAYFAIYPKTSHPSDFLKTMQKSNILHHIACEVQCNGTYPYFARQYFRKLNADIAMTPEEERILKENPVDFVSMSYYCSNVVSRLEDRPIASGNLIGGVDNDFLRKNDWGWHIDPEGFRIVLNDCYQRYKKPIAVVENGLGAYDYLDNGMVHDPYREEYLRDNISQMKLAAQDGVDIFAYTMWSLIDIVSLSANTIKKRYGLIYVDVDDEGNGTFNRIKKDSFYYYKHIIETNGEDIPYITRGIYAPVEGAIIPMEEVKDEVFSQKMLGDGFAVIPEEGIIKAPVSGKIIMAFPTGHAFGIETKEGFKILVHVGIDTVEAEGEGFTVLANENDQVQTGDPLVKIDLDQLKQKYDMSVIIVITNASEFPDTKIDIRKDIDQAIIEY